MELTELLKIAAEPHLIASAQQANLLLAELQGYISDLRAEVSEKELEADLYHNKIMQGVCESCHGMGIVESAMGEQGTCGICNGAGHNSKSIALKESEYKISTPYREYQTKKGLLTDVRAVRRNLERHCELLIQQEKYRPKNSFPSGGY